MSLTENSAGTELYHTTSIGSGEMIARYGVVNARPFASFSSRPVVAPSGWDLVLVFDAKKLMGQLRKVEYTDEWFSSNPREAEYIGGRHKNEAEWISYLDGHVNIKGALKRIIVRSPGRLREVQDRLQGVAVPIVPMASKNKRMQESLTEYLDRVLSESLLTEGRFKAPKAIFEAVLGGIYRGILDRAEYEVTIDERRSRRSEVTLKEFRERNDSSVPSVAELEWILDIDTGRPTEVEHFYSVTSMNGEVFANAENRILVVKTKSKDGVRFEIREERTDVTKGNILSPAVMERGERARYFQGVLESDLKESEFFNKLLKHLKEAQKRTRADLEWEVKQAAIRPAAREKALQIIRKKAGASGTVVLTSKMLGDWNRVPDGKAALDALRASQMSSIQTGAQYRTSRTLGDFSMPSDGRRSLSANSSLGGAPQINVYVPEPVWVHVLHGMPEGNSFEDSIATTVEHEVIHWAQRALPVIMSKTGVFGLPSDDPDLAVSTFDGRAGYLSSPIEFFPWLNNEIREARSAYGKLEKWQVKIFIASSTFFTSLKQKRPDFWKKAVREFYREMIG